MIGKNNQGSGARVAQPGVNTAGKEYSKEDQTNGNVHGLHALTLQQQEQQTSAPASQEPLPVSAVRFRFGDLPDAVTGLLPSMLTHCDSRALAETSRRLSRVVASNPAFSLTRASLNTGLLRLSVALLGQLQFHERAMRAIHSAYLTPLLATDHESHDDADMLLEAQTRFFADAQGSVHSLKRHQLERTLTPSRHITPAREAEIRSILQVDSAHREMHSLVEACDWLLEQLDADAFTPDVLNVAIAVSERITGFEQLQTNSPLHQHLSKPTGYSLTLARAHLVALRLDVLDVALRSIVERASARLEHS